MSKKSIGLTLLVILLLLYLVVAFAHAYLAPLTTGPDELAHYEYVAFVADNGRLPQTYQERAQASYKSDQPPMYHLITSVPASWIDPTGPPYLKRVYDHPRRQLIERTRHSWGINNTEDELWPYRAEVLRWQVGRWMAILFGLGSLLLTFFIARDVFAGVLPALGLFPALGAVMVVAFIPRFTLTGSMLNYETTVLFFASLYLWVLVRIAITGHRKWWYFVLLGLFMGLAITAKLSAIILPLETIVALWLVGKYAPRPSPPATDNLWQFWLKHLFVTFVAAGFVLALWFGFVVYHFNTIADDGWYVGLLRPLVAADASDATTNRLLNMLTGGEAGFAGAIENLESGPPWEWAITAFRTFWVAEIEQVLPLGWFGLLVVLGLCLVAGYGLVIWWRTDGRQSTTNLRNNHLILGFLLIHLLSPLVLPLIRYAVTSSLSDTAQGRHVLFLAAPAFAILLVWGFWESATQVVRSIPRFAVFLPGTILLLWSIVQLWIMNWAYLPPLPVRTVPEAKAQVARPVDQPFNDYVTLAGFDYQLDEEMLHIDLNWQSTAVSPYDYLTEVSLVDTHGDVQAQWLGYPTGGRYPTRAWDEGDIVRDTVWLPLNELAAGDYSIEFNLIPTSLNPPTDSMPSLTLDSITLTESAFLPTGAIQVWQNGQPLTRPEMFRYRETILVTFDPALVAQQPLVQIANADGSLVFDSVRQINNTALFIIGPEWVTGDYHVQITLNDGQQITSDPYIQLIDRWQRQFDLPPMQHVVEANFADQVKLLGYDLGAYRAEPGGGVPVTLYWQGLDWMGDDYTIFTKLLATDQTVHGGRDRLPQEGYRTIYWVPGEVISDPFGVPVNADALDGVYSINVGLYKKVGGQAVSLPLVQDGQPIDADSVNIGPIKIGTTPPALTLANVDPQFRLNQSFGNAPNLTLLGYDLSDQDGQRYAESTSQPSELKLMLYWRSESPLAVDYTTFVHVRDTGGQTVAQKDQPPLGGAYPTSLWDPGEIIADEVVIPVPPELPAGEYQLVVGLYDFVTGQRLAVPGHPVNEVLLLNFKTGFW